MKTTDRILITGASGMVGRNLSTVLKSRGFSDVTEISSRDVDLKNQNKVDGLFSKGNYDYLFHLAARVGGIKANMENPYGFLYDNLMINTNVINSAKKHGVKKMINLGSSCIYPRESPQPMKEEYFLTGLLEPTNEAYAISKIASLKLGSYANDDKFSCINLMPSNLYGYYDHFDTDLAHVISSLISRMHNAKEDNLDECVVWGSGNAMREFLFSEDLAEAMLFFMIHPNISELQPFVNIGSGIDISIRDLAELIKEVVGFEGSLVFDKSKPDGMPRKLVDVSRAHAHGWRHKTELKEGLEKTYDWYLRIKTQS